MKVRVDQQACVGCGLCVDICPAVFEMDNNLAKAIPGAVHNDYAEACLEAVDSCPVSAIKKES